MASIEDVAPELRGRLRILPRIPVETTLIRNAARLAGAILPSARVAGVEISTVERNGAHFRMYVPEVRSGAALIWMHGGGMVMGTPLQTDRLCADTAAELGIVIFSVVYRLAPEHVYPAALDDCHAVWELVLAEADERGIDPSRVSLGGESAGGGLAAALAQRIRAGGGQQPAAQWLFYPMLDDRTAAREELDAEDHWMWNNRSNRFGWQSYLDVQPGAEDVPEGAVPARAADLAGLPPAWIGVGDLDLFHAEDVAYAQRLEDAGVPSTLHVVPGAPHSFYSFGAGTTIVEESLAAARRWLAETV